MNKYAEEEGGHIIFLSHVFVVEHKEGGGFFVLLFASASGHKVKCIFSSLEDRSLFSEALTLTGSACVEEHGGSFYG